MKTIKTTFLLLVFILSHIPLAPANAAVQGNSMVKNNPRFIKLLTHEIQNRAFAFKSIRQYAKARAGKPDEKIWSAYFALEQLNQKKYQPVAEKFGISQEATFVTNTKTCLVGVFLSLFPQTAINGVKDATIDYLAQLEELETLASSEDSVFFRYVVLQEKVQAQAITLFTEGKADKATDVIEVFVAQYN